MIIDIKETIDITPKNKRKHVAIGDVIRFAYKDGSEERYAVVATKRKGIRECPMCHMRHNKELAVRMCAFSDMSCPKHGYLIRVTDVMEDL